MIRQGIKKQVRQLEAAERLEIGQRQINRRVRRFRQVGDKGLVSRQPRRASNHRLDANTKAKIEAILKDKYPALARRWPATGLRLAGWRGRRMHLLLLDEGWNCQQAAHALLLDDDMIRGWRRLFEQRTIEGLTSLDLGGSASNPTGKQEDDLTAWAAAALPRSTRRIGAWIKTKFGFVYESRSGLIALLHRLGREYLKPDAIPRKCAEAKQKAFIASGDKLLNSLAADEAGVVADAGRSNPHAPAAGRRAKSSLRPCRRAGAGAPTFTARSTSKPAKPR